MKPPSPWSRRAALVESHAIPPTLHSTREHPEHLDAVVEVLVEANMHHPMWRYLVPDERVRANRLRFFNRVRLRLLGERSEFWLDNDGRVAGHVVFAQGSNMAPSLCTLIKLGFLEIPFRFGLRAFWRFYALMNAFAATEHEILKPPGAEAFSDWTLEAFAVRSDLRGLGMGGRMLRWLIETRARPSGARVVLLTQDEGPRRLYLRVGFVDIGARPHPMLISKSLCMPNWAMEWRGPLPHNSLLHSSLPPGSLPRVGTTPMTTPSLRRKVVEEEASTSSSSSSSPHSSPSTSSTLSAISSALIGKLS